MTLLLIVVVGSALALALLILLVAVTNTDAPAGHWADGGNERVDEILDCHHSMRERNIC